MMDGGTVAVRRSALDRLRRLVESKRTQQTVATLIVVNGVILGFETSAAKMAAAGELLRALDWLIVAVFVAEMLPSSRCSVSASSATHGTSSTSW